MDLSALLHHSSFAQQSDGPSLIEAQECAVLPAIFQPGGESLTNMRAKTGTACLGCNLYRAATESLGTNSHSSFSAAGPCP
jgi:hypothetical protein